MIDEWLMEAVYMASTVFVFLVALAVMIGVLLLVVLAFAYLFDKLLAEVKRKLAERREKR